MISEGETQRERDRERETQRETEIGMMCVSKRETDRLTDR